MERLQRKNELRTCGLHTKSNSRSSLCVYDGKILARNVLRWHLISGTGGIRNAINMLKFD